LRSLVLQFLGHTRHKRATIENGCGHALFYAFQNIAGSGKNRRPGSAWPLLFYYKIPNIFIPLIFTPALIRAQVLLPVSGRVSVSTSILPRDTGAANQSLAPFSPTRRKIWQKPSNYATMPKIEQQPDTIWNLRQHKAGK
jgi:hypothetical protein